MQRIFASTRVTLCVAVCASPLLIGSSTPAASQLLDPGWQLVYAGQPNSGVSVPGGDGGFIQSTFGDGVGQRAIQRPYQRAPVYYQQVPPQPARGYQPAPAYYQQLPPQQPRAYPGGPVYYQQVPPQQPRAYPGGPVYYQQVPPQQPRAYPGGPVYYQQVPQQQVPLQQARGYQPAPTSYQQQPPQQRGYQPAPAYYQQVPPQQAGVQPAPVYSQPTALPQRAYQPAPVYYQQGPAQRPGAYQPAPMSYQQAPVQQPGTYQSAPMSYQQAPTQQPGLYQPAPAYFQQPPQQAAYQPAPALLQPARNDPVQGYAPSSYGDMAHPPAEPQFERQLVDYQGNEPPGTVVIDTPHYFLYLVLDGGKAIRYGIGVGRPGFTWAGVKEISAMRQWPDWYPPVEMLQRRPDLPRYMPGGPENPLGARALYLGSTLYRIHGSNEPWTIGTQVSSGCIRLRNEDVIDLYGRVKVGTKVVVI